MASASSSILLPYVNLPKCPSSTDISCFWLGELLTHWMKGKGGAWLRIGRQPEEAALCRCVRRRQLCADVKRRQQGDAAVYRCVRKRRLCAGVRRRQQEEAAVCRC